MNVKRALLFLLQEMERTVHMFETFLWTGHDKWFPLSILLFTEQSSEPFNVESHQLCAEPWWKVLSPSFFLSVEFGAIVSGTWNQPAYKNQTELQKHCIFHKLKTTTPQIGDFGATETAFTSAPLSVRSLLETSLSGSRPAHTRKLDWGSSNCVELFKQWEACLFVFSSFYPYYHNWVWFFFLVIFIPPSG